MDRAQQTIQSMTLAANELAKSKGGVSVSMGDTIDGVGSKSTRRLAEAVCAPIDGGACDD